CRRVRRWGRCEAAPPRLRRHPAAAAALVTAACGGSSSPAIAPAPAVGGPGSAETYLAVGASRTGGAGVRRPPPRPADARPRLVSTVPPPRAAPFVGLGTPSATTELALAREVPQALALHPTVVTVWLNVNDLVTGVPADRYEDLLDQVVHQLRQD